MRTIVLILRGCPAAWLGPYGNEWVVTPHLDRMASESVVFDRHLSDCPDAGSACRAWLGANRRLLGELRSQEIPTILVRASHSDRDLPDWFYAEWAEVFDSRPREGDNSPLDALIRALPELLDRLVDRPDFLLWIEIDRLLPPWVISQEVFQAYLQHELAADESPEAEKSDESEESDGRKVESAEEQEPPSATAVPVGERVEPWFDPPTGPFDVNDPDALTWLATSFGSVVTSLDAELGALFDILRQCGLDSSATWILTSDLGFPLGEHGQIGVHRPWLHEELIHLPLIIRLPGAVEAGRRVPAITQPPDLCGAIRELFRTDGAQSKGLLGLSRGESGAIREYAITSLDIGIAAERAIRTDEWAYLRPLRIPEGETREPKLYRKPDDRWEVNDLFARNTPIAEDLEELFKQQ